MPVASVGVAHSFAIVRDTAADDIEGHLDGTGSGSPTTDTTTATLANAFALRFGRNSGGGGTPLDGEIMGIALFREALTDAEILAAGKALGAD